MDPKSSRNTWRYQPKKLTSPAPTEKIQYAKGSQEQPTTKPVFKRLSPEERKERTAKGLCFNCDDRFIPGHKCKGKMFMLSAEESYLLEMEEQEEIINMEEELEEIPIIRSNEAPTGISMHAFEGHMNPSTIRLEGFI